MPLAVKMPKRLKQAAAALYLNNGGLAGVCEAPTLCKAQRCNIREDPAKVRIKVAVAKMSAKLTDGSRLAKFFPPDFGIRRTIAHIRQFLFNLQQAVCACL
jgi:hypothetical protein